MISWKDIAAMFEELEILLIASFKRNLQRHINWEKKEGFSWPAWQALKLRDLRRYRRENLEIIRERSPRIDVDTALMLEQQYQEGTGEKPPGFIGDSHFFGVNDRRVNALVEDMQRIEQTAQRAALRTMDDVYRQTILRAETAMATGSVTLPQAIDMAAKDFLNKGIACIRYRDGRMVNIADYIQMALRTAATRSYLQGEAKKRARLGVDTVLVSQYGACSETCLPWQGRVYIDDVWGGWNGQRDGDRGKSANGNWYPLLSVAVENGLYHPNCRHTHSTWYEGVSSKPEPLDPEKVRRAATLEQRQREMEREVRRYKRLAAGTLDPKEERNYQRKVRESQQKLKAFVDKHGDVLRRDYWRENTYGTPAVDKSSRYGMIGRGSGTGEYGGTAGAAPEPVGRVDVSNPYEVERALKEFADAHVSDPAEHMMVIAQTGEVYELCDNDPYGVDSAILGEALRGSYNLHTHPPDTTQFSFSHDADIPGFFADGSLVMEAADYKYRYRFVRPEGVTFEQWDKVRYEVERELLVLMEQRRIPLEMFEEMRQHVLIEETCKRLGINCYWRWLL